MTLQEFRSKRTAKFILLRMLLVYVFLIATAFPLLWFFDRDYFTRNGLFGFLLLSAVSAIAIVLAPALDRLGLRSPSESKPKGNGTHLCDRQD